MFARGDDLPARPRRVMFHGVTAGDLVITATYDNFASEILPPGEDTVLGTYTVHVPPALVASGPKTVAVIFALDRHGLLYIPYAQVSLSTHLFEAVDR